MLKETKKPLRRYDVKLNSINMAVGSVLIVYGVCTLPLPAGSIFCLVGGVALFNSSIDIKPLARNLFNDVKFKLEMFFK